MVRPTPYIVALHDFLSDAETELFKSLAVFAAAVEEEEEAGTYVNTIRLTRSQHAGKRSTSDKRTSKQLVIFLYCFPWPIAAPSAIICGGKIN